MIGILTDRSDDESVLASRSTTFSTPGDPDDRTVS